MKLLIENSSKNEIIKEAKNTDFSLAAGKKYKTPAGFKLRVTTMNVLYNPITRDDPQFYISGYVDINDGSNWPEEVGWGGSIDSFRQAYMMTKEEFIKKWIKEHPENKWGIPEHAVEIADKLGFILDTSEDTYPKYTLRSK